MRLEEKEYTKSIDLSIWKKILPFLKQRKGTWIMVILMNLFCSVIDIIMPLFQRHGRSWNLYLCLYCSNCFADGYGNLLYKRLYEAGRRNRT